MNTLSASRQMPPLARNTIDSNAVAEMADWINSLGGTPALAPPVLTPASGIFTNQVTLTLQPPDGIAALYYTLDGTLLKGRDKNILADFFTAVAVPNESSYHAENGSLIPLHEDSEGIYVSIQDTFNNVRIFRHSGCDIR